MHEHDDGERILNAHLAFAAGQRALTRTFARQSGLHITDSLAIVAIIQAEQDAQPLTPARLAEEIGLSGGATSILLNRLEAVGYVVRQRGHADRRVVTLHSTPAIHTVAEEFFAPLRHDVRIAMDSYTAEELRVAERIAGELTGTFARYVAERSRTTPS